MIEKLTKWPAFLAGVCKKINEIIDAIRCLYDIQGRNGVKVTKGDSNIIIEMDDSVGGGGLPEGEAGDMLYHDGDGWVPLPAPTGVTENFEPTLRHDGTAPYWDVPEGCE